VKSSKKRACMRPLLSVAAAVTVAACSTTAPSPSGIAPEGTQARPATPATPAASVLPGTAVAAPRLMQNGRPACGNVTGRAPRNPDCE